LNRYRYVVPVQGKLDEVVHHGAVGIGEVQPGNDDGTLLVLGFTERFPQGEGVLNAARHTKQKSFLDVGFDEVIPNHELLQASGNYGEENLSQRIGDGDRSEFRQVIEYILGLLKEHNKSKCPIARNVLTVEDFEENPMGSAEDGVAFFVNQVRQAVQSGARVVWLGSCMPLYFLEVGWINEKWEFRWRGTLHSFERSKVVGTVFVVIKCFEVCVSFFLGTGRCTIQTLFSEQILGIFVRVLLERTLGTDLTPLRLLIGNLAAQLVVTFDQLEPELLHCLGSTSIIQAGLLHRLDSLLAVVLLLTKSL
jgi:hypothetical protein